MAFPLTTLTQAPVHKDVYLYGGDDTQLKGSRFFATIVRWDADTNSSVFKTNFVFVIKIAFVFLDSIGVGYCLYGEEGFEGRSRHFTTEWERCQSTLKLNQIAREKIVAALCVPKDCGVIPVVEFREEDLNEYLKLDSWYLREGECVVQLEDTAGRKAIVMLLEDRHSKEVYTATVHQVYRETSNRGSQWTLTFDREFRSVDDNIVQIAAFIENVRKNQHERFAFVRKLPTPS